MEKIPQFVIFNKPPFKGKQPIIRDEIVVSTAIICLRPLAAKKFDGCEFVDLFIDREINAIKIIPGTYKKLLKSGKYGAKIITINKVFDMPKGVYEAKDDYYVLRTL